MRALVCIDLINDFVHPDGKLNAKYADFIKQHDSLNNIAHIQDQFRQAGAMIVHFRVGFGEAYAELNENSTIFKDVAKAGALKLGTWGTDLHELVAKKGNEPAITKHRVSPFYRTRLDLILRTQGVKDVYLCGLATNMAVSSAAREAHDHDYNVTVISDACIAADDATHEAALTSLAPFATVAPFGDVAVRLTAA